MKTWIGFILFLSFCFSETGCKKDKCPDCNLEKDTVNVYQTTPYNLQIPTGFPTPNIPENNLTTEEGIALGKKLFYDSRWIEGGGVSCNSCHAQEVAFSVASFCDINQNGNSFIRNVMPLQNLAWETSFAWGGRSVSLEKKIEDSIENRFALATNDSTIKKNLTGVDNYLELFKKAFGNKNPISLVNVSKALSQFLRTLITGNSRYDKFKASGLEPIQFFTPQEFEGYIIFNTETGDCFHCHSTVLVTDNSYHNNGLDATLSDLGFGAISGRANDNGKFRAVSLRNIEYTAPYMHDGRFQTLEEVVDFYSFGVQASSPNIDPLMKKANQGGIQLTTAERQSLVAFLKTFSDASFLTNTNYAK